jgi:SAM-dependent methyltransferase
MNPFDPTYSLFYNEIHRKKDYDLEVSKLVSFSKYHNLLNIKSAVLDFGCGTGKHVNTLTNLGYNVIGYDPSVDMIQIAIKNFANCDFFYDLKLIPLKRDLIYSLFDVLSYQISNEQVTIFFNEILKLLNQNGSLIVDYWNFEGVLSSPPSNKNVGFSHSGNQYRRIVNVLESNTVGVTNLSIEIYEESTQKLLYQKNHSMRAFSANEISELLPPGMNLKFVVDQFDYKSKLNPDSWRALALITKNN